jgi:hypothetical protein
MDLTTTRSSVYCNDLPRIWVPIIFVPIYYLDNLRKVLTPLRVTFKLKRIRKELVNI